ncbi:YdcF family protein [Euzebya rosea]|uniref:YdcF family protein n=1 Tax=Euzebya rosea TaxID=2052804 RepID=UPI000D3E75A3|nr:YdcF family protein [Euzebya rosea]
MQEEVTSGGGAGARRAVVVAVLLGVLTYSAGAVWVFGASPDPLPGDADVILVLAGNDHRAVTGMDLLEHGAARELVITFIADDADDLRQASAARICADPPPHVRCMDPDPDTTRGEAAVFAAMAKEEGWDDVILVTAGFHARRAEATVAGCTDAELSVVHAPYLKTPWLDAGWVVHETGGLLALLIDPACS